MRGSNRNKENTVENRIHFERLFYYNKQSKKNFFSKDILD